MTSNPSDFSSIPPEMRGLPPSRPDLLAANLEAFKQAMDDQIKELNKLLESISKDIQGELKDHPENQQSIVKNGTQKIHETIDRGLQDIQSQLADKFPSARVPPAHIDRFIQDLHGQLAEQFDVEKIASTVSPFAKAASPFELFKETAKARPQAAPKEGMGAQPPSGPSVNNMNNAIQQWLDQFLKGQAGPGATGAAGPSFNAQFVLSLIQLFLGTGDVQSKQILFEQIQMAMNQGPSQGTGAAGRTGRAGGPGANGPENVPAITGGPAALQFGAAPTTIAEALKYAEFWLNTESGNKNSAAYHLASDLVSFLKTLPSNAPLTQLQSWIQQKFTANKDVYLQYPGLTTHEAQNLYFIAQAGVPPGTPPAPTQIDSIIFTANFFLQQQPNAQTVDAKLLSGWINAMQTSTKGSQSTQADIINTDWFKNTFQNAKQDVYMQYVGVSSTTLKQIFDLLKAGTPPKPTIIDEYELAATYALNQQFQANDKVLFQALIQIYESLGSNASISQLQQAGINYINQNQSAWSSSTYDARQAFTALTSNGSQNLFNTLNAVIARIAAQTPGSASFNMAQYLVELIGTNIPYSVDQTAFGNQLIQLFTNADFYAQFPGVTTDDIQWVNTLIGQQVFSVTPTQGDQIIFEVYQFLQSLDPKSSDYQFVFNFLKTCQSWGSSFTTASVQNWFNTTYPPNMDIFMANPDIGGDLVKLLSNITGQTLTPTANDQLYKQAYDWSQSLPSVSPDAALAGALSAYLLSIGSTGAYDPGWAKKIFDGNFANYPGISVNGIIEFCKIAGLQISGLDPYRILIAQWESSFQPNTPQYRFAAAILSEITTLGPTGTVDQLTSWLQGLLNDGPGKLDAYCQFPGLTQQDIEALTGILPKITVPPPTILDGIYNQYAALLASDNNPQDIALIKSFLNAIQAMGNMAGANQGQVTQALQGWFNNLFSHDDPYLQYPDASPNLISMLYGTVGKADPGPTYIDQQYKIAYDYTHSLPVNATADIKLMNAMLQEMQAVGSYGNFINISYWALGIVKTNFADFPGVTQATKTEFQTIAGIDISQILAKALQWQQSLSGNQNSGAYKLATALVKEIQSLGTAGTIVDVENWFSSTFGGAQDPYMQNPGPPPLGQSDLQVLYNIILIGTAPPPTVMDARFEEVWNFTLGVSGQNNINLMNALLNEIRSLGSNGSLLQLAQWGSRFAYESPLYRAADPSIKQAFNKLARQG